MSISTNLQLGVSLCQTSNCKILKLTETTGSYSLTNLGGWGTPNPSIASVTSQPQGSVTIEIVGPSGNTIASVNYPESSSFGLPDSTGSIEVTFAADGSGTFLLSEAVTDGIYIVTYTVTGYTTDTYTAQVSQTFLLTCNLQCCVDSLFHAASQADCTDCKNEKLDKALEAEAYLKAAEYAAACNKTDMAKKHLAKAQWICDSKNCLNC